MHRRTSHWNFLPRYFVQVFVQKLTSEPKCLNADFMHTWWSRPSVMIAYLLRMWNWYMSFLYQNIMRLNPKKGPREPDCESEGFVRKQWCSKMQKVREKKEEVKKKKRRERAIEERSGAQKGIRADRWTGVGRNSPAAAGTAVIILTGVN